MGDAIHVREYRDRDLPAVLDLLRAALGESRLLQRTPELFRWKHIDNPFGRSVLLIAEIDDTIVGLRAFMRWQLDHQGEAISCGRAVDTATHPGYVRRGIFRRLTEEALDVAEDGGIQLIFNTPNERSRPGYLKMGWSDVGPIRVLVRPHLWRLANRRVRSFPSLTELAPSAVPIGGSGEISLEAHLAATPSPQGIHTPKSDAYVAWRFGAHPTARYGAVVGTKGSVVLRANLRGQRSELVLSDTLGTDPREAVTTAVRGSNADYEVASFPPGSVGRSASLRAGLVPVPGVSALQLVARPMATLGVDVLDPANWSLALSDVELL